MDLRRRQKHIIIDTGNVLRPEISSDTAEHYLDKLCEGLKIAIAGLISPQKDGKRDESESSTLPEDSLISMKPESEEQSIVTVKFFPNYYNKKFIWEAVHSALKSTKASVLDYVVFSLPELPTTLICLQEMYIMLEALVDKHIIKNIILSEIMDEYFIDLYNWAKVKPGIQVYWGKDFVLPPTLENFIEQNSVQLLKHKDPRVILPHNVLDLTLMEIDHPMGSEYATQWVARIDVSDANSGELKRRGYSLKLTY